VLRRERLSDAKRTSRDLAPKAKIAARYGVRVVDDALPAREACEKPIEPAGGEELRARVRAPEGHEPRIVRVLLQHRDDARDRDVGGRRRWLRDRRHPERDRSARRDVEA